MYQGRVYSISGEDKRFPALYETALKHGYSLIHPNCRHEFIPYFKEFHIVKGDFDEDVEIAKKTFEDNRDIAQRDNYAKWQEKK